MPIELIKNIVRHEYMQTLNFFKYNPIIYYVYSVNYWFELFNEESDHDPIISELDAKTIELENNPQLMDKINSLAEEGQEMIFKSIDELS
jgi:hypothetical protein